MNIILVQAPSWTTSTPPYSLALLKAVCEEQGHKARCLDLNIRFYRYLLEKGQAGIYDNPTNWYSDEYVSHIIREHGDFIDLCVREILRATCGLIGFTVTGLNKFFSEEIAKRIKTKNKDILIIFGGPHCFKTELGEVLLHNNPDVDAVCCLEGEKALPRILEMAVKEGRIGPFPGIASRGEDGRVLSCEDADLIEDLDSLPFADYSDFDMLEYGFKELPISISRGCIYRCSFCSESRIWKKYRFRSAENIFKEIEFQLTRYPFIKSFFFSGSLINGNIEALSGLADLLIDKKVSISWGGQASLRKEMDEAFISRMRRAGLSHVSYGLESASPAILERMSKAFTVEAAERIIRQTKGAGIRTDVNIVVGYPGETEDDIAMTADFLSRNRRFIDEIYYHPLVIMRGSYLYMHKDELGIRFDNEFNPNDWYSTNEENTLEKRLETVAFFKRHIGRKGRSFFTSAQYQQFIKERTSIRRTP